MKGIRPERIASAVREIVATALLTESKDPGLEGIVVTGARVSADLRVAWVTYHLHDDSPDGRDRASRALDRARGFLRGLLVRGISSRTIPELRFEFDEKMGAVERIQSILRDVLPPTGGPGREGEGGE